MTELGRLCSVVLPVPPGRLKQARDAYAHVLGRDPEHFIEDKFYSFRICDCELRLVPQNMAPGGKTIAYWEVKDIAKAYGDLLASGKFTSNSGPVEDPRPKNYNKDVAVRASVYDEYQNFGGVITNPLYPLVKRRRPQRRAGRWAAVLGLAAGVALLPRLLNWLRTQ